MTTSQTPTQTSTQEDADRSAADTEESQAAERQSTTPSWRGVASEDQDEIPGKVNLLLRERSRKLLTDLLYPHRKVIAWLIVIVLIENGSRLAIPYLIKVGIDRGIPPLKQGGAATTLVTVVVVVAAVAIVQAVSRQGFLWLSGRIGQDILLEVRRRVYDHFQRLSLSFHEKYTSGRVVSRLTSDVEAIYELLEAGFDGLVSAVLTLFGTGILLLILDVKLGLVALCSFPILLVLTAFFRRESSRAYRKTRETVALVIVHFVESMGGIRAVQAFRREPRNQEIFDEVNDNYRRANQWSMRLVALFMPSIKFVGNLTVGVVLLYGGYLAFHGEVTVGVLTAFLLYLRQFFEPMQEISQFYNSFQKASAALEKLSGVLEEEPAVPDPEQPATLEHPRGRVRFEGVSFGYDPDYPVLPEMDLQVPAGQTIALVGATGAGKTTLAKLLSRFYDPVSGRLDLDGVDLRDLDERTLRQAVVMVTQENYLFTGTVADNIRFGRPDATMTEVIQATRAIGAHEFINRLPDGYETQVGKSGGRFSAGQRQLIAFARAFLADPAVLILDEATSSLDVPSERLVQRALRTILADRTALIIAHRLSTVEIADRVLVMEQGRIVEDGEPDELIAGSGRFAGLHQAWLDSLA